MVYSKCSKSFSFCRWLELSMSLQGTQGHLWAFCHEVSFGKRISNEWLGPGGRTLRFFWLGWFKGAIRRLQNYENFLNFPGTIFQATGLLILGLFDWWKLWESLVNSSNSTASTCGSCLCWSWAKRTAVSHDVDEKDPLVRWLWGVYPWIPMINRYKHHRDEMREL